MALQVYIVSNMKMENLEIFVCLNTVKQSIALYQEMFAIFISIVGILLSLLTMENTI